jgi:hypothetical protein
MNDREPYLSEKNYPFNLEDESESRRTAGAFLYMAKAMDDLLSNPPSDMKGEYLEDQRAAWDGDQGGETVGSPRGEGGIRGTVDDLVKALASVGTDALRKAGLLGRAGRARFRQIRDAVADFAKLRSAIRADRLLHACVYLLASLVNLAPGIEAVKEVFEGFKYLADLAVARS